MMQMEKNRIAQTALRLLAARCPRLTDMCYWAGTSSIAIEELGHRESFDLDFHTQQALVDVRPILAEVQSEFAESFSILQAPDAYGSGFSGVLKLPTGEQITVEVLANFEDVPEQDALLITERLQAWTDTGIAADLEGYPEVDPEEAFRIRDRLLRWLKALAAGEKGPDR